MLFRVVQVRIRSRVVALSLVVLLAGPEVSLANSTNRPSKRQAQETAKETRLRELRELIGEVSVEEAALLEELAGIRERLEDLNAEVRRLTREADGVRRRLRAAERDLTRAVKRQEEIRQQLIEAQARVEAARDRMNATVTALYQHGQEQQQAVYMSIVEDAKSPHEVLLAARYLEGSILAQRADLDEFVAAQRAVEELSIQAEQQAAEARAARDQMMVERDRIEVLKGEAVAARAAARSEEAREQELLDQVQDRKNDFLREMQLLQVESSAIGEMLRQLQAKQKLAPRRKKTFKVPVQAPMSSRFGPRTHPVFGDQRPHTGLDFAAGAGSAIHAGGPGRVVWAGPRGGYGNLVVIDHGNGLATLYAHQSEVKVSFGQDVVTGQLLGLVGSTGVSTGPHLHFEVREKGTPVDPLFYL
jgi:murein DD-endopeptidase MepM/ murein hydrolase activator NlpD